MKRSAMTFAGPNKQNLGLLRKSPLESCRGVFASGPTTKSELSLITCLHSSSTRYLSDLLKKKRQLLSPRKRLSAVQKRRAANVLLIIISHRR